MVLTSALSLCRRLLAKGKIIQPYKGSYASRITYGMMLAPLRVHNVCLVVESPWLGFSDEVVEQVGDVKIRIFFGVERRKVSCFLSCDRGMDRDTLLFAYNRFCDLFEEKTTREVEDVLVKTFELNRDIAGVRLDGVQCFTRQGLNGFVERIYQKGDVARAEVKVSSDLPLSQFEALLHGGVPYLDVVQAVYVLRQELEKDLEGRKFDRSIMISILQVMQELLKRLEMPSERLSPI